jgi:hypothetical protein
MKRGHEMPNGVLSFPRAEKNDRNHPGHKRGSAGTLKIEMHGASRNVAVVKAVDILLQLLEHYETNCVVNNTLPDTLMFICGHGKGSRMGGTARSKGSYAGERTTNATKFTTSPAGFPVVQTTLRSFFATKMTPQLMSTSAATKFAESGNIFVTRERLKAWCESDQARLWREKLYE